MDTHVAETGSALPYSLVRNQIGHNVKYILIRKGKLGLRLYQIHSQFYKPNSWR